MKALYKTFVLLLACIALASCGGGGNSNNSAFGGAPVLTVSVAASPTSIGTNSFTTLLVTVKNPDGSPAQDGAGVNATLSPATIGTLSGAAGSASGTTASNTLSGGTASFVFNSSNQAGTAHIIASVTIVTSGSVTGTVTYTGATDVAVTPGNTQDPRLQLTATSTTLPLNPFAGESEISPFPGNYIGSPFISEVTVTWRHSNGELVSGTLAVNVSIDPVTIASFSTLDDPSTDWTGLNDTPPDNKGNEFLTLLGSGPVNVTGGNGVIFVHADDVPGTAVLTITAVDPDSGQTISSQQAFTVAGSASTLPSSITAVADSGVYISGSGGPQSTVIRANVTDGSNAQVPDPNGFDNVEFTIVGPAGNDARLTGVNAAGQSVTATTIDTVTHNGVASVTFQAGAQQGPVQVKATADRGDNNVDNGIQDAVSATTTVVVSDGKLYSLTLTSPSSNAILINSVSTQASLVNQSGTTLTIPPDPDATYSFTVSAIGNDRQGNPVLPNTQIKFGSIDSPVDANGNYEISGAHGDPVEGGSVFTATDGQFTTAGGGAGPGDSLLVFGKLVDGNSNLESAAKVSVVVNAQTLEVATPFNLNDTTGSTANYGPVLPYIIGRAQIGNITSPSFTNSVGVASTTLNYPVSALGHVTAIWAQGNGTDNITEAEDLVTDIALAAFPGVAPATIVVSPNPIPGNITVGVDACIFDALGSPLSGVVFQFSFTNLGVGSGTLDNISSAGNVPQATDTSGCVATTVATTGIAGGSSGSGSGSPDLTFSVLGVTPAVVPIVASGGLILLAHPSEFTNGTGGTVTLTLLNSDGTPVPNVQLTGSCKATGGSLGIDSGPGVTNAQGQTTALISGDLNAFGPAGTGDCTFTTATGAPTVDVTVTGIDECLLNVSPPPASCPATP